MESFSAFVRSIFGFGGGGEGPKEETHQHSPNTEHVYSNPFSSSPSKSLLSSRTQEVPKDPFFTSSSSVDAVVDAPRRFDPVDRSTGSVSRASTSSKVQTSHSPLPEAPHDSLRSSQDCQRAVEYSRKEREEFTPFLGTLAGKSTPMAPKQHDLRSSSAAILPVINNTKEKTVLSASPKTHPKDSSTFKEATRDVWVEPSKESKEKQPSVRKTYPEKLASWEIAKPLLIGSKDSNFTPVNSKNEMLDRKEDLLPVSSKAVPEKTSPRASTAPNFSASPSTVPAGSTNEYKKSSQDTGVRVAKETRFPNSKLMENFTTVCDIPSPSGSSSPEPFRTHLATKMNPELPLYEIPEELKKLLEKDVVPKVLTSPLSPSSYVEYFACLLYAEDFYIEKWDKNYLLSGVTLKLRLHTKKGADARTRKEKTIQNSKNTQKNTKSEKEYVAFEIDSIPEKRPYLLARDFVFLQPVDRASKLFEGYLAMVQTGTTVLAEFKDDFYSQHSPTRKYNVSFSFNRVCLKRAHHAVAAALGPLLFDFLFPSVTARTSSISAPSIPFPLIGGIDREQISVIHRILKLSSPPPYLIEGPLSEIYESITRTGLVIQESILQIYRTSPYCRILVCTPRNRTCDNLMSGLYEKIPNSNFFRANAAFRNISDVPDDILESSLYQDEKECFTCPPLSVLLSFKVISSTFMSTVRLRSAGIGAGHFTHIFLVDASSSTEPEAVVPLVNFANEKTVVVVSGSLEDSPRYIRSVIARRNGLNRSFFHRLLGREPYSTQNPMFIGHLGK